LFFIFILDILKFFILLVTIPVYQSSADVSGRFRLKAKSRKSLILSCLQNLCFFIIFDLGWSCSSVTPSLGCALLSTIYWLVSK